MRGSRGFGQGGRYHASPLDLGSIFDEVFEAARNFQEELSKSFTPNGERFHGRRPEGFNRIFNENTDYYPTYCYPPMNVFFTGDRSLVFEFALAGFEEKDISLSFQGDYMVFQALLPRDEAAPDESISYLKHRLKKKDIEKQKYFVPLDKYAQDKVKAVYRNGILRVTVPPKEELDQNDGIKIEIVNED
jgi:HSP20 family molecular chaperone IbpA